MKVSGILSVVSLMAVFAIATDANAAKCTTSGDCTEACFSTLKGNEKLKPCNITVENDGKDININCSPKEFRKVVESIEQTDPSCKPCTIKCEAE